MKCRDCKFWKQPENASKGACHRYPPVSSGWTSAHPVTSAFDWCGEFAKKETKENDNGKVKRHYNRKAE